MEHQQVELSNLKLVRIMKRLASEQDSFIDGNLAESCNVLSAEEELIKRVVSGQIRAANCCDVIVLYANIDQKKERVARSMYPQGKYKFDIERELGTKIDCATHGPCPRTWSGSLS